MTIAASAESARLLFGTDREEQGTANRTAVHIVSELAFGDRTMVAYDSAGARLVTSQAAGHQPQFADAPADASIDQPRTVVLHAGRARVLAVPLEGGIRLVIAMSMATVDRQLSDVSDILLALLPSVLLVGGAVGAWGVGFVLRPVNRVAALAEEVGRAAEAGESTFSKLPGRPGTDELSTVTNAFNHLVDRTSAAIARERRIAEDQRSFLADAAHELRTPVAIIRSEAEVALSSQAQPAGHAAALRTIADEAARLGELVSDLLFLGRGADPGPSTIRERLFLDDLANHAVARVRKLPEAAGRTIRWGQCAAAPAQGSASLVERAIVALLHNALIHAPGAAIELGTGVDQGQAWIRVKDFGPGIPAAERDRVFQRFVRLTAVSPGTGLGLPIARAIALHHGGGLVLEGKSPRTTFLLWLPADAASKA